MMWALLRESQSNALKRSFMTTILKKKFDEIDNNLFGNVP